jgi:hypothetical protein
MADSVTASGGGQARGTEAPLFLNGVTRFQHLLKISSILIRNTVAPPAIRTTPRNYLATARQIIDYGVVVSNIPLDLQRRSERRWAARFAQPAKSVAPRGRQTQHIDGFDKGKRKTARIEAVNAAVGGAAAVKTPTATKTRRR